VSRKILSQVDAEGNAAVVLNRPEVRNAFDPEMVEALTAALKKLAADPRVRAVVLSGSGGNFCAGADIEHMKAAARYPRARNLAAARATARMLHVLYTLDKPTLACVRGAARGGGVGLVAACDIAVAERAATFRLSEVKLGIAPAMISPYLIGAMGPRHARRYMVSGEEFDAAEAYRIGLVHDICEEPDLDALVARVLAQLRSSGPGAIAEAKRLAREVAGARVDRALVEKTAARIARIRATPEAQEGLAAFLEKRRPSWAAPASGRGGEEPGTGGQGTRAARRGG
jgi:methylglutaconyl-CoA hydratase